jgi:flavodoxin I
MKTYGIFYGSTTGRTQAVAESIQEHLGQDTAEVIDISTVSADDLMNFECIILGSSTWGIGDLQDDWDSFFGKLDDVDFSGKKVAFFGTGDQEGYPDSFVNAIGTLYKEFSGRNAEIIGLWPTEGYVFESSTAVIDGSFAGLVIDDDNQAHLTEERVASWVKLIKNSVG